MSASLQTEAPRGLLDNPRVAAAALGAGVVAVAAMTVGLLLIGDSPFYALLPALAVAGLALVAKAPLRASALVFLALALGVDDHTETFGQWRSPFAIIGDFIHEPLNQVSGIPLAVSGTEVLLVMLFALHAYRRSTGSRIDVSEVPPARVLRGVILIYLAGVAYATLNGLGHGMPLAPWKLRNLLHPLVFAMFFLAAFRGPRDLPAIGKVIILASSLRSIAVLIVQRIAIEQTGGKWETATSHGDSVLFAVAVFLLIARILESPNRRTLLTSAPFLLLNLAGAQQNERRLVWVMIGLMLALTYYVTPMKGWKVLLTRIVVVTVPITALYVGIGWNSESRIFAPVITLRSVADTSKDHSAYWREVENWNIAMSLRDKPILGLGLGGQYTEVMFNDDISSIYKEYRQWPHNTVLGQLLLLGLIGFTAVWLLLPTVIFLAVRSYARAETPELRVAALGCMGAVVACLVMAYGDTGAHYPQYKIFLGLAIAVVAKLSVYTGAWPSSQPSRQLDMSS